MPTTSERRRAYRGPVLYSNGFRAFFLFAGIWSALAMLVWVVFLSTGRSIPSRMSGVDWHMHEMVFGYATAVIAGFLLTAVPNWTGRLPIVGWPTALLSGLWLLGRAAIFFSAWLPPLAAPIIDGGFLVVLAAVLAREIIAGSNWRNLVVVIVLGVLAAANILFHIEAVAGGAHGGYAIRLGIGTAILLMTVIGGRVIPSFTRNWLARREPGRLPAPFSRFDIATLGATAVTMVVWVLFPESPVLRGLAALCGVLHLIRLGRWAGWRTFSEPLVTILHIGYLFVPAGFVMLSLGEAMAWTAGVPHAWAAGAVGVMTLAMMTRASLGHSGRALTATGWTSLIYVLVIGATLARIAAEMLPAEVMLLHLSAAAWIAGFGLFAVVYFPVLTKRRIDR